MEIRIVLRIKEEIISEFEELPQFQYNDEENNPVQLSIQEVLRKYIIECINDHRIEIVQSEAEESADLIQEDTIPIIT